MADILYTYQNQVYANITNKCNCNCIFCIRFPREGVGSVDVLSPEEIEQSRAFAAEARIPLCVRQYG